MVNKYRRYISGAVLVICSQFLAFEAVAQTMLTLENTTTNVVVELTEKDLLELEQHEFQTENDHVDGMATFKGPLARDVLALLEGDFEDVNLSAANDYSVTVPFLDFVEFDVIFAMEQDGVRFSRRNKGPLWLVYPISDHRVLQQETTLYNDRMIWQLVRVTVD